MYYIPFDETAKINYSFLLALYGIAEKGKTDTLSNTIRYSSLKELCSRIQENQGFSISPKTASLILKDRTTYKQYFTFYPKEKTIVLNNNFRRGSQNKSPFVVLTEHEASFLISRNEGLLTRYFLYLKYYCGRSRSKQIDTTAKQILEALGYSAASGKNISSLSSYNTLLRSEGLIQIHKYRDVEGRERNIYSL